MRNIDYYAKEIMGLFGRKSIMAILSTTFLLLLCIALTTAFFIGKEFGARFAEEANIAVFYDRDFKLDHLVRSIQSLDGVVSVEKVTREEAFEEMKAYLGEERSILERLGENPFDPYLRVRVSIGIAEEELDRISQMPFVSHVRDNREVIYKIRDITNTLAVVGLAIVLISFSTLALISYYVAAENLHAKSEYIGILKSLKAPYAFIIRPFLWYSVLINFVSGSLATLSSHFAMSFVRIETVVRYDFIGIGFCVLSVLVGVLATLSGGRRVSRNYRY